MSRVKIKVLGPYAPWDESARIGRLIRPHDEAQPVLLHPGPTGGSSDLEHARVEARHLGAIRHAHVLQLLRVMPVSGVLVAVHEAFSGASLRRVSDLLRAQGRQLPLQACFELAAAVADGLNAAWLASDAERVVLHPGPTPAHVLVSVNGAVKLVGLRAPARGASLRSPPGYGSPEGCADAPALVYGVGALLVELLGGEAPPVAGGRADRHEATLRRAMIRVLSRPGARPPEPAVTLVQSCLAWDPTARPALASLSDRLAGAARGMAGPAWTTWAGAELAQLWPELSDARPAGGSPAGDDLPMAVGPLPDGVRLEPAPPAAESSADLETESTRHGAWSPDAPTAEETEEVERTQELPDGGGQEVTVSTPRPTAAAPVLDKTVMTARPVAPDRFDDDAATVMAAAPVDPSADDDNPVTVVAAHITARWRSTADGEGARGVAITGDGGGEGLGADLGADLDDALDPDALPSVHSRGPYVVVAAMVLLVVGWLAWRAWPDRDAPPDSALEALAELEEAGREAGAPRRPASDGPPVASSGGEAAEEAAAELAKAGGSAAAAPAAPEPAAPEAATASSAAAAPAAPEPAAPEAATASSAAAGSAAAAPVAPEAATASLAAAGSAAARARSDGDRAAAEREEAAGRVGGEGEAEDAVDAEVDVAAAYIQPQPASSPSGTAGDAPSSGPSVTAGDAPSSGPSVTAGDAPASGSSVTAGDAPSTGAATGPVAPTAGGSGFVIEFHAADDSVITLEVECHMGRVGSGRDIRIPDAVKGPCRVVGRTADGRKLVANVAVSQDRSWSCFAGGVRACR